MTGRTFRLVKNVDKRTRTARLGNRARITNYFFSFENKFNGVNGKIIKAELRIKTLEMEIFTEENFNPLKKQLFLELLDSVDHYNHELKKLYEEALSETKKLFVLELFPEDKRKLGSKKTRLQRDIRDIKIALNSHLRRKKNLLSGTKQLKKTG